MGDRSRRGRLRAPLPTTASPVVADDYEPRCQRLRAPLLLNEEDCRLFQAAASPESRLPSSAQVMISAKEEPDASVPPAIDGLLRVHKRVIEGSDAESTHALSAGGSTSTRLLVPLTQAGILIGKHGSTIKSIQESSKCVVRVVDYLSASALQDDRIVEIQGEPAGAHKAVELIAGHLRKFLVDRSVIPLFEMHLLMPNAHMEQKIPPQQSWGHPQGLLPNAGGVGYGGNPPFMPPKILDNFYPPSDLSFVDKQPHHGVSVYGREAPHMGVHSSANIQPQSSIMTQVTQHMQIPLSYADAVIGTAGSSISYIRRASGATITIQETRGVPGEMTVEINGSASQVQTAQQLIQNFMAEAAGSAKNTATPLDQGYNSYQTHGSTYVSPPANAGPAHVSGSYGAVYGTNYGY